MNLVTFSYKKTPNSWIPLVRFIFLCNWHILWQNALYCIWVNLSRFKMIITSGYIEDMMITQELLKKSWIYKSLYLIDTCRSIKIYWSSILVSIPLDLSSLWDFWYSLQRFNSKRLFFLWVCIILIGLGKPKVCVNLIGIGEPI